MRLIAVIGLILAATVFATAHRVATGGLAGLIAACGIAVLAVLVTMLAWGRTPKLATALSITALVPIAAALGLAVPGESGASQILLAAAGVTAWAIVSITVAERAIAVFTAVTVIGVGTLITAGAAAIWAAGHRRHRLGVDRAGPSGHRAGRAAVRDVVAPTGAGDSRAR